MNFTPFENEKVRLRKFKSEDLPILEQYLNNPELFGRRNVPWGIPELQPLSIKQVEETLKKWDERKKGLILAIEKKKDNILVGHIDCNWHWDSLQPGIAVTIAPEYQRQTFGSQALQMMIDYVFKNLPALSINCWVPDWNTIGIEFAKLFGFSPCGRMRRAGFYNGKYYDFIILDMLREEWRTK
jgi:RimJ/RimL family protein N-acetyltransferase